MEKVAGRTFCITGKLEHFATKAEAFQEITSRGGNASTNLTPACHFLVLGAKGNENYAFGGKGTKQVLAETWIREGRPISIITENQLLTLIEANEEVAVSDRGELPPPCQASAGRPILREQIGDLECSSRFFEARPGIPQVLRATYQSAPLPPALAQEHRTRFQAFREKAGTRGLRRSVRTEIIPVSWSLEGENAGEVAMRETEVVISARIVCVLDGEPDKATGRETAQEIRDHVLASGLGGSLSLRIWDASNRYGRFWLKRMGASALDAQETQGG